VAGVFPTGKLRSAASAAAAAVSSAQGVGDRSAKLNGSGPRGVACGGGESCRPRSHGTPDPTDIIRDFRRGRKGGAASECKSIMLWRGGRSVRLRGGLRQHRRSSAFSFASFRPALTNRRPRVTIPGLSEMTQSR
jgi:hypothetical protein